MERHLRNAVAWLGLIVALAWLFWGVRGCSSVEWSSGGPGGGGEPGTKYFVLTGGSLGFQATPLGLKPELVGGGCPHGVSLDQFEMNLGDIKEWPGDFVAVKHADGCCAEIAIYCQGVVCGRHTFEYDEAGRARRRVDTHYESRREGEGTLEWAARLRGRTPAVACVSVFEYAWSPDGRTAEVILQAVRGNPPRLPPIGLPDISHGELGQKLETWQLDSRGLITSVLRDGKVVYSGRYDDVGRLLGYEVWGGEKVENRYDAHGRLLETKVVYGNGTRGTIIYGYPGGPGVDLPPLKEPGDAAWVVTYDEYGRVSRIREHAGPSNRGFSFEARQ